jgi:hypothetical protein
MMRVKGVKFEGEDWNNLEPCTVQCRAVMDTGRHEMRDVLLLQTLFGIVKYGTLKMAPYIPT